MAENNVVKGNFKESQEMDHMMKHAHIGMVGMDRKMNDLKQ